MMQEKCAACDQMLLTLKRLRKILERGIDAEPIMLLDTLCGLLNIPVDKVEAPLKGVILYDAHTCNSLRDRFSSSKGQNEIGVQCFPQDFEAVFDYINSFPKTPRDSPRDVPDTARSIDTARSVTVNDWIWSRPGLRGPSAGIVEPLPVVLDEEDHRQLNDQWSNIVAAGRLMGALFKAVAPLPFDLIAGKDSGASINSSEVFHDVLKENTDLVTPRTSHIGSDSGALGSARSAAQSDGGRPGLVSRVRRMIEGGATDQEVMQWLTSCRRASHEPKITVFHVRAIRRSLRLAHRVPGGDPDGQTGAAAISAAGGRFQGASTPAPSSTPVSISAASWMRTESMGEEDATALTDSHADSAHDQPAVRRATRPPPPGVPKLNVDLAIDQGRRRAGGQGDRKAERPVMVAVQGHEGSGAAAGPRHGVACTVLDGRFAGAGTASIVARTRGGGEGFQEAQNEAYDRDRAGRDENDGDTKAVLHAGAWSAGETALM